MGIVDAELSCHKKSSPENPSHIKGVGSGCRDSEQQRDRDERLMRAILPDPGMGQISERLLKHLQEQLLTVTLQRQPERAPFLLCNYI